MRNQNKAITRVDSVIALKKNSEVLGVRVVTKENTFDMDVDDFIFLDLGYKILPSEKLIKQGNLWVTENEKSSGVLIKEFPLDDEPLTQGLINFMYALEKRKKSDKEDLLRGKYYTLVGQENIADIIRYHMEVFERGLDYYGCFSQRQKDFLMGYFREKSKVEFAKLKRNKGIGLGDNKLLSIADVKGGVEDWVYEGMEDTGYFGGGYCSLGHNLRYRHLAYSPSLGKRIVFGIKCVSDFFSLPKDMVALLTKIQDGFTYELKSIYYFEATGAYSLNELQAKNLDNWFVGEEFRGSDIFDVALNFRKFGLQVPYFVYKPIHEVASRVMERRRLEESAKRYRKEQEILTTRLKEEEAIRVAKKKEEEELRKEGERKKVESESLWLESRGMVGNDTSKVVFSAADLDNTVFSFWKEQLDLTSLMSIVLDKILSYGRVGELSGSIVFDIIKTVKGYKRVSVKQYKHIRAAYLIVVGGGLK